MKPIYFDNASTTYVYPEVVDAINDCLKENWGNPSNLHSFGLKADFLVEEARKKIAYILNVEPEEIIFTSCASESNAFAINQVKRCFCTDFEHHDIKENKKTRIVGLDFLEKEQESHKYYGGYFMYANMLVNNETGAVFDVNKKFEVAKKLGMRTLMDATQALGNIPLNLNEYKADYTSFSFHKVHAPKGIGAVCVKKYLQETSVPIIFGSQERGLRGGTLNVPYIVGSAIALERATKELEAKRKHCEELKMGILSAFRVKNLDFIINPSSKNDCKFNINDVIPTLLSVSFKNVNGETLMLELDTRGIYLSTGSACNSGDLRPSEVLTLMSVPKEYIEGTIRISMSLENTMEEAKYLANSIAEIVERIKYA